MSDFTFEDGKEVNFDFHKITVKEWSQLHNPAFSDEKDYIILSKLTGLEIAAIEALPFDEFNRLVFKAFSKGSQKSPDPN